MGGWRSKNGRSWVEKEEKVEVEEDEEHEGEEEQKEEKEERWVEDVAICHMLAFHHPNLLSVGFLFTHLVSFIPVNSGELDTIFTDVKNKAKRSEVIFHVISGRAGV